MSSIATAAEFAANRLHLAPPTWCSSSVLVAAITKLDVLAPRLPAGAALLAADLDRHVAPATRRRWGDV